MTKVEKQALAVARTWRRYTEIDHRLAKSREASRRGEEPRRPLEERERDAMDVRPAAAAYKKELETLAQMVLGSPKD
jgi:hypothetical protein